MEKILSFKEFLINESKAISKLTQKEFAKRLLDLGWREGERKKNSHWIFIAPSTAKPVHVHHSTPTGLGMFQLAKNNFDWYYETHYQKLFSLYPDLSGFFLETPFIIPLNFDYATQTLKKINNTQSIVLSKLYKDLNNSLEGSIINGKEVKMADVGSNGVEIIYSDDSYEQIPWHSTVKYTGNVTL